MSDSKNESELAPRTRLVPTYAARGIEVDIPKYEMPQQSMLPSTAYQIIHDELRLDGYSMLNLATFVTTVVHSGPRFNPGAPPVPFGSAIHA